MNSNTGDLHDERKDYARGTLARKSLNPDPLAMFGEWMQDALNAEIVDATAMTLATVSANGTPSARVVLLKQYNTSGFFWYTNYASRKGRDLLANPNAAIVFYWRELERQVRLEGTVAKASAKDSDDYFNSRPEDSRFSAVASPQSKVIPDQQWLTAKTASLVQQHTDKSLVRPAHWGGYALQPATYEFWQGRPNRQHDRFRYLKDGKNWQIDRLAP